MPSSRTLALFAAVGLTAWLGVGCAGDRGDAPLRPAAEPAPVGRAAVDRSEPPRVEVPPRFTLRVVDTAGVPVAGVALSVGRAGSAEQSVSGADGVVGFARQPPAGPVRVRVDTPAFARVGDGAIPGEELEGAAVVVRRRTACAGRVVFADDGVGVPGVELSVPHPGGVARTVSDADGGFALYGDAPAGAIARVAVVAPGSCVDLGAMQGPWWGRTDVELRLPRAGTVVVEAVAADTGAPLGAFGVRLRPVGLRSHDDGAPAGRGEAGRALVVGAWPGLNDLQVVPDDRCYAPSEVVTFRVRQGETPELRLAVAPRRAQVVRVVDTVGRPVPETAVRYLDPRGRGPRARGAVAERRVPMRPTWVRRTVPLVVDEAVADADGRAVVHVEAERTGTWLEVVRPGGAPLFVRGVFPDDGPLRVEVEARSAVVGRIAPPPPAEWRPAVALYARGGGAALYAHGGRSARARAELDADGRFALRGVPSGRYQLVLEAAQVTPRAVAVLPASRSCRITWLRDLVVAGGLDEVLELDGRSLRPVSLRGVVDVPDGAVLRHVALYDDGDLLGRIEVGADGAFGFPPLWGRLGVRLRVSAGTDGRMFERWDPAGGFDLAWGERVERRVVLGDARLEVELREPDGRPHAAGVPVWARRRGETRAEHATTGDDGIARFGLLTPGRWDVSARIDGRTVELGAADLAAGGRAVLVRAPR